MDTVLNYENRFNTGSLYLYACCRVVIFRRSKLELRTRTYVTGYVGCILMKISVFFFLTVSQLQAPRSKVFYLVVSVVHSYLFRKCHMRSAHPSAETRSRANQRAENQMNFHLCAPRVPRMFPPQASTHLAPTPKVTTEMLSVFISNLSHEAKIGNQL